MAGGTVGLAFQAGLLPWIKDLVRELIVEILGQEITESNEPSVWIVETTPPSTVSSEESGLGNYMHGLATGSDIPLGYIGHDTWQGTDFNNGEPITYLAHDHDTDGFIDTVYRQEMDGTWWVATRTINGVPDWQPSTRPTLEDLNHQHNFSGQ